MIGEEVLNISERSRGFLRMGVFGFLLVSCSASSLYAASTGDMTEKPFHFSSDLKSQQGSFFSLEELIAMESNRPVSTHRVPIKAGDQARYRLNIFADKRVEASLLIDLSVDRAEDGDFAFNFDFGKGSEMTNLGQSGLKKIDFHSMDHAMGVSIKSEQDKWGGRNIILRTDFSKEKFSSFQPPIEVLANFSMNILTHLLGNIFKNQSPLLEKFNVDKGIGLFGNAGPNKKRISLDFNALSPLKFSYRITVVNPKEEIFLKIEVEPVGS